MSRILPDLTKRQHLQPAPRVVPAILLQGRERMHEINRLAVYQAPGDAHDDPVHRPQPAFRVPVLPAPAPALRRLAGLPALPVHVRPKPRPEPRPPSPKARLVNRFAGSGPRNQESGTLWRMLGAGGDVIGYCRGSFDHALAEAQLIDKNASIVRARL